MGSPLQKKPVLGLMGMSASVYCNVAYPSVIKQTHNYLLFLQAVNRPISPGFGP